MVSPIALASISQLGPAADRQDAAGHESSLGRKEEYGGIRDGVTARAVTEEVNNVQVLPDTAGILLLRTPSFQHWRPHSCRTNCIHANGVSSVVGSHGLGERNHGPFTCNIGRVVLLPHKPNHARRVKNRAPACGQSRKCKSRRPIDRLHVDALEPSSHSCSVVSSSGFEGLAIPTLLWTASIRPKRSITLAMAARIASPSETSAGRAMLSLLSSAAVPLPGPQVTIQDGDDGFLTRISERALSANAIRTAGQHNDFACEITRHMRPASPSCGMPFWRNTSWPSSRTARQLHPRPRAEDGESVDALPGLDPTPTCPVRLRSLASAQMQKKEVESGGRAQERTGSVRSRRVQDEIADRYRAGPHSLPPSP